MNRAVTHRYRAPSRRSATPGDFKRRAVFAILAGVGLLGVTAIVWFSKTILLLLFAGCVSAILFSTAISAVQRWTRVRRPIAFAIVLLTGMLAAALIMWVNGPAVAQQVGELRSNLTSAAARVATLIQETQWGRWVIAQSTDADKLSRGILFAAVRLGGAMTAVASSLAGLLLILFTTMYLSAEPEFYRTGLRRIIPADSWEVFEASMNGAIQNVRFWLLAKLISMVIIGCFVSAGLWILQIPLAGLLGVIAGLLTFIPNLGPLLSVVPAALLGFAISPTKGLLTVAVFALAHFLEGNLVTPLAERAIVKLPPFLTLSMQLLLGTLTGPLGIALAAPFTAAMLGAGNILLSPATTERDPARHLPNCPTELSKDVDGTRPSISRRH